MAVSKAVAHQRAIVSSRMRCVKTGELPSDDAQLAQAREDLRRETLLARVERLVKDAPPLSNEQIERIAALLRVGGAA